MSEIPIVRKDEQMARDWFAPAAPITADYERRLRETLARLADLGITPQMINENFESRAAGKLRPPEK